MSITNPVIVPNTLNLLPLAQGKFVYPGQFTSLFITEKRSVDQLTAILSELTNSTKKGDPIVIGLLPSTPLDTILPVSDRSNYHNYGTSVRLLRLERITQVPTSILRAATKAITLRLPGGGSALDRKAKRDAENKPAQVAGFLLLVQGLSRISIDSIISSTKDGIPSKANVTSYNIVGIDSNHDDDAILLKELKAVALELIDLVGLLSVTSLPTPTPSIAALKPIKVTPSAAITTLSKQLSELTTSTIPASTLSNVSLLLDALYALFSTPALPQLSQLAHLDSLSTPNPATRLAQSIPVLNKFKVELEEAERTVRRIREWSLLQEMGKIRDELVRLGEGDENSFMGRLVKGGVNSSALGSSASAAGKGRGGMPMTRIPANGSGGGGGGEDENDEEDDEEDDVAILTRAIRAKQWTKESKKVAMRELKKLKKTNAQGGEYGVIRNYIEMLLSLPWIIPSVATAPTEETFNDSTSTALVATSAPTNGIYSKSFITRASAQLDEDHFGMDKVKKRLIEWLVVLRLKEELSLSPLPLAAPIPPTSSSTSTAITIPARLNKPTKSNTPILLLLGPPGTGKTSIAKSLAAALDKPFTRISLGGVRDEATIRGFLRTYVGAMPGNIIDAVKRMGSREGVILLDEIDKLSSAPGGGGGNGGNPEAALLEVLDPGQNESFIDRYVGIPFDLSKVLFIATANSLDGISAPLLDRMEVIEIDGYVHEEKLQIALRYLLPAQLLANGLAPELFSIAPAVLLFVVTNYTREAGVRSLDRAIGSLVRGKVVEYSSARDLSTSAPSNSSTAETTGLANYRKDVEEDDVRRILGNEFYAKDDEEIGGEKGEDVGVALGLAYMGSGNGGTLYIESLLLPGSSALITTGSLGPVIIESAQLAFAWIKAHGYELGLVDKPTEDPFKGRNVHLHMPSGGVKKDGPSAGVAFTVAIVSLMKNVRVKSGLAMTGEITLRGTVGAVGGIREKVLAAHRSHLKSLLLPWSNQKDVEADLPKSVTDEIQITFVKTIWEALEGAFEGGLNLDSSRRGGQGGKTQSEVESRL